MGSTFWLILTFIFVILEILIPTLITIWFAIAAIFTVIVAFAFKNLNFEILTFTILSIFFMLFTRPYAKKYLSKNKENFDASMVGTKVSIEKVVDTSHREKIYEVKFKGSIWTAISSDTFSKNDIVIIDEFKGNKIIIKK
ncbi:MAG: NfeD family protein [Fusobacterium sp.]|uniref:NfeD family protein n=1 Tax=Fusobacterium sp. TaxID=68766 RepID=UPI0026DCD9E6|nr:NfeD family protein [Fusobacterium sp.]MDO4689869.1 NfeD family protein [Fusobacterium sp.]